MKSKKCCKNGKKKKDERVFGLAGGVSGAGSVISAHNVCHALCMAVVAFLSVFGIIVSSDILMWLQDYNLFFWSMGMIFLGVSFVLLYLKGNCISKKMIVLNIGLLIIGFPFLQNWFVWTPGILISLFSVGWYMRDRFFYNVNNKGVEYGK